MIAVAMMNSVRFMRLVLKYGVAEQVPVGA
jgi:hypothetical protein